MLDAPPEVLRAVHRGCGAWAQGRRLCAHILHIVQTRNFRPDPVTFKCMSNLEGGASTQGTQYSLTSPGRQ